MRFMDADQSWNLLRQKVLSQGNCRRKFEEIGKEIARSCKGLPLAITVIAGLLSTVRRTPASWENIARNVNEAISRNDGNFAETILSSSYNHLSHHLRSCFLYMGFFREDHQIRVSKLINLWVAEGFLKLPGGSKSSEEVAEDYLEDLIKRSLVLVINRKSNGKIKTCSVHDLVRDLCIRKAQEEKFLLHIEDNVSMLPPKSTGHPRRVSMVHSNLNSLKGIYGSRIRTIMCVTSDTCEWDCLRNIRLLRVFDVVDKRYNTVDPIFQLPAQVIKPFHLTYLALPYLMEIPAAISNLENLQTLIIYPEMKSRSFLASRMSHSPFDISSVCLPSEVWRLLKLRHLVSCCFDGLPKPQAVLSTPKNLQTLSKVKNFKCTGLIMISTVKKLGISYFADVNLRDIKLENLVCLDQLEKLKIRIKGHLAGFREMVKPVFPTTLKKLTLSGQQRSWEDMGVIGSLPNLEVLKLKNNACSGWKWETSEGEFRQLKFLLINGFLLSWITESSHFPSLKCLVLHHCDLNEIPDGIGEIPTLELIEVDNWNKYLVDSAKQIQEEQRQIGETMLFEFVACVGDYNST